MAAEETVAAGVSPATQGLLLVAGVSLVALVGYLLLLIVRAVSGAFRGPRTSQSSTQAAQTKDEEETSTRRQAGKPAKTRGPDLKTLIKQQKAAEKAAVTKEDAAAQHALFINTLKGHTDAVHGLAWSADGRGIATACADSMLRIFDVHDLANPNPKFKWLKTEYPPLAVGFGNELAHLVAVLRGIPDMAILTHYAPSQKGKPHDMLAWEATWSKPGALGREALLDMVTLPSVTGGRGGAVVLLTTKREGRVYSMGGGQLGLFEPNSLANHALAVSGNGRFIAVASFTSEVKVWELSWAKDGFKGCSKAMDLKGHSSQVMSAALSADGSQAVTASIDGTLRVWNLRVRYHMQEDPKTLLKAALHLPPGKCYERMALSPDGRVIAAALPGALVHFLSITDGSLLEALHTHEGRLTGMAWAPRKLALDGRDVSVLATCSDDRRVRLWRCPLLQ